jgi:hypothetical protein
MKEAFNVYDWPSGPYKRMKVPVKIGGENYPNAIYMNTVSTKGPRAEIWASLDQSGFIDFVNEKNVDLAEETLQFAEQFKAAFGYAQRVAELCQRLEKIEVTLLDVVKKLDLRSQPQSSLWVPIQSFAPEPYEILKPITAVITPVEDGFEAGLFDANLFSTGDTEVEAIQNLKSMILETYSTLDQLGDSKLGPGPLRQRNVLSTLIRKSG